MAKLRILTVIALTFGAFSTLNAQNLQTEGLSPSESDARPSRGMTSASVESRWGSPEAKVAPVGDPPISRWEYKDFIVFFEYDRVIHAVVRRTATSS